jgi:hypothetical protein
MNRGGLLKSQIKSDEHSTSWRVKTNNTVPQTDRLPLLTTLMIFLSPPRKCDSHTIYWATGIAFRTIQECNSSVFGQRFCYEVRVKFTENTSNLFSLIKAALAFTQWFTHKGPSSFLEFVSFHNEGSLCSQLPLTAQYATASNSLQNAPKICILYKGKVFAALNHLKRRRMLNTLFASLALKT